jgi:hypothetical protein
MLSLRPLESPEHISELLEYDALANQAGIAVGDFEPTRLSPWRQAVALVVFLRGVNVGGHRRFRPRVVANELSHLGVVSIGAAGTFVVRASVAQSVVRDEFERRLPAGVELVTRKGSEIKALKRQTFPEGRTLRPGFTRFVSIPLRRPTEAPTLPLFLPSRRDWLVKVSAMNSRFVCGQYRPHMKVIRYLGALDDLLGVRVTTRSWSTICSVVDVLAVRTQPTVGSLGYRPIGFRKRRSQ